MKAFTPFVMALLVSGCEGYEPDDIALTISHAEISQSSSRSSDDAQIRVRVTVHTGAEVNSPELEFGDMYLVRGDYFEPRPALTLSVPGVLESAQSTVPIGANMTRELTIHANGVENGMLDPFCDAPAELMITTHHMPPGDTLYQVHATLDPFQVECVGAL